VLPVRSATLKPCAGQLVVGWVTTSEYWLLIVFVFLAHQKEDDDLAWLKKSNRNALEFTWRK
jgi:hypothetical protein